MVLIDRPMHLLHQARAVEVTYTPASASAQPVPGRQARYIGTLRHAEAEGTR